MYMFTEKCPIENQKKLVLAFDAKRLFNNFTGLGNYSRTLVRNLQKFYPEHEYHLFTPTIKTNEETAYFLNNPNFIIHTPPRFTPLWRSYLISKEINQLMPDIYHGLSHEIPYNLHKKIIRVVTFHDLIFEKFPSQFNWIDLKIYRFKYRSSAHRADQIIAISESTKNDLSKLYNVSDKKISVLYQSCNDVFQNQVPNPEMLPESLKGIPPYYLYVGSLIERKGLIQIVIAYSKIPEESKKPFVIVGTGNKNYCKKIDDLIRYYNLENNFHFIKNIPNQALVSIYDHCFALIYPSVYEGFGIPIIECLFRNKPVITSETSSMPEAGGPGALLINPYEPEDIKNSMLRLQNLKLYKDLSEKGKEYVGCNFLTEVTATATMNYYTKILSFIK